MPDVRRLPGPPRAPPTMPSAHHLPDARCRPGQRPGLRRGQHPGPPLRDESADRRNHRLQDSAPAGRRARRPAGRAPQDISAARQHLECAFARGVGPRWPHLHHALRATAHRRVRSREQGIQASRDRRRILSAHHTRRRQGRVWFKRALSNQTGMLDRMTRTLHAVRPTDARFPRMAQRATDRRAVPPDQLGGAPVALVADRSQCDRYTASVRHRHHSGRQGVVRTAAHRRNRRAGSGHRRRAR